MTNTIYNLSVVVRRLTFGQSAFVIKSILRSSLLF